MIIDPETFRALAMSLAWTFGYLVGISPALVIIGLFLYAAYKFNPKG